MPVQHESTTPAELAACRASTPCPACRKRGGETLVAGTIHGYGSEPRGGWVPRRLTDVASDATAVTFGVELETQRLPGHDRAHLTGAEAANVAQPRGHWYPTSDSSVDGPEFASQPATLAYWRSIAGPVGSFMRTLIHGGLRAHDGGYSCSMHVNVGADAFATAEHLARFIRLATMNPRFTTRMAQRTHSQVSSWARYDMYPDMASCERLAREYRHNGTAYTGHSAAVNLESRGRVEFRSPRGTLRLDRFMAKLEWTAAMVEYTRNATRVSIGGFVAWVMDRRADYPEFVNMMADLMPGRVAGGASRTTSPATRTTSPASPAASTCAAGYAGHAAGCSCTPDVAVCGDRDPDTGRTCIGRAGHRLAHRDITTYRWTNVTPAAQALMTDMNGRVHTRETAEATWYGIDDLARPDGALCTRCGLDWGLHSGIFCEQSPARDINGNLVPSVWSINR